MLKVLIVEDNPDKAKGIEELLIKLGVNDNHIQPADCIEDALDLLETTTYSLVVLDLKLPREKNGNKKDNGGLEILEELAHDKKKNPSEYIYRHPGVIFALTEHESIFEEQEGKYNELSVFVRKYEYGNVQWESQLTDVILSIGANESSKVRVVETTKSQIVITVHGIMSDGEWQNDFKKYISETNQNIEVVNYDYKYFPILSFLFPGFRGVEVRRFKKFLELQFQKYPDATFNFISHSFGTFLFYDVLSKMSYIKIPKINNVILCGSVLKKDTKIEQFLENIKGNKILNECSYNDFPLLLSKIGAYGLGDAGRKGFKSVNQNIVIHRNKKGGHGRYFESDIYKDWLEFIMNSDISIYDTVPKSGALKFLSSLLFHKITIFSFILIAGAIYVGSEL